MQSSKFQWRRKENKLAIIHSFKQLSTEPNEYATYRDLIYRIYCHSVPAVYEYAIYLLYSKYIPINPYIPIYRS